MCKTLPADIRAKWMPCPMTRHFFMNNETVCFYLCNNVFIFSPTDLETRRLRLLGNLLSHVTPFHVTRHNAFNQVIKLYTTQPNIAMTSLEVSFIGERGEDFTGLSRKLFTLFWDVALECFFAGRRELRPRVAPYNMNPSAELWHTLGIIFSHGFVLINYVPYRLSYGTLHYLMSGSIPDSATILSSYLSTLSESDDSMITNALRVNRDTRNFDGQ